MASISRPVVDTVIVCLGCHRKLVAPIDQSARMVRCPKCGYTWDLRDKTETRPSHEILQGWTTAADAVIEAPAAASPLDVLVVEDNDDSGYLIRRSLERFGHRVTVCVTVEAALITLRHSRFDLITTGQKQPDMTGLQFLHALRREGITTPAIMLTSFGDELLEAEARRAGAIDYILKDRALTFLAGLPQRVEHALARFRADSVRRLLPHEPATPLRAGDTLADQRLKAPNDTAGDRRLSQDLVKENQSKADQQYQAYLEFGADFNWD